MKTLLLALATIFSLESFAINPHMKITVARENYIAHTVIGQSLVTRINNSGLVTIFNCFDNYIGRCSRPYFITRNEISIHADFISASPEYLSWIVFLAYQDYSLKFFSEMNKIPETLEYKNLLFTKSMDYVKELISNCNVDLDFYSHPNFNFARKVDLPMCEFFKLSNDQNLLNERISLRSKVTDDIHLTAQDIIDSNEFSEAQKNIARKLLRY